jgi:hypothetical protein
VTTSESPRRPTQTLGTVIGLLDGAKKLTHRAVTALHRTSEATDRFNGFTRTYQPNAVSDGQTAETLPPEQKLVELVAERQVVDFAGALSRRLDLQLTMDHADTRAFGDIRVPDGSGGEIVLATGVPVTTLMVLEKVLEDVRTFLHNLPVQDPSKEWRPDPNADGVYVTEVIQTNRNKKTPKVVTKAPATDKHQADTELYWVDEPAGVWNRVERTGALSPNRYGALLERAEQLLDGVKTAREEANRIDAPDKKMADSLFGFLIRGL